MIDTAEKILEIKDLDISFYSNTETVHAIRGVSLTLRRGETVALVGESGSGKSVTMKAAMGILPPNAGIGGGSIIYYEKDPKGEIRETDITSADEEWLRKNIRGRKIAMVFQDPMTSLNPTMTVGDQLALSIKTHEEGLSKREINERVVLLLREVGITEPERRMRQYPHEFSGGMRQRIVIAIALSCNPEILICDEPTTALDVTIQERILELIVSLQQRRSLSVIYITHDLGVVAKVADYVNVMYAGKIIESGTIFDVFYDPRHPYTWGLLSAIPDKGSEGELSSIPGTPPFLSHDPVGDAFAPRNPYAMEIDFKAEPPMFKISDTHYAATWLLDERAPKVERPKAISDRIERMKKEAGDYVKF
jgi:oligopeptide transport system ATP-binding protein